jgi:uncharacterized protein
VTAVDLPLFPLNSVLFPGATLPLHVFEDRYKEMIARCLLEESPFGVVLIREGTEVGGPAEPFDVGTTARITRLERLPEGRMNLTCVGVQRFRVVQLDRSEQYLQASVELLQSVDGAGDETARLAGRARELFAEYVRTYLSLSHEWVRDVSVPQDPPALSDFIASRLSVDVWAKQRLLEEISTRRRLAVEVEILRRAIEEMTPRVRSTRAARWRGLSGMN